MESVWYETLQQLSKGASAHMSLIPTSLHQMPHFLLISLRFGRLGQFRVECKLHAHAAMRPRLNKTLGISGCMSEV